MRRTIFLIRHEIGGVRPFGPDVNTLPIHGDDALIEKHCVSKRASAP